MSDNRKRHDSRRRSRSRSPFYREKRDTSRDFAEDSHQKDERDRSRERYREKDRERDYENRDHQRDSRYRNEHRQDSRDRDLGSRDRDRDPRDRDQSFRDQHQGSRDRDQSTRDKDQSSRDRDNSSRTRHYSKDRNQRSRSPSHHRSNRYDDRRNPHQKLMTNQQMYENSPRSSISGSPYSTPPPPPPVVPPPPPSNSSTHYANTYNDRSYSNQKQKKTTDPRQSKISQNHNSKKTPIVKRQNFKLLIDPSIKKGHTVKIVRYDGVLTGQPPVVPKDPRRQKSKVWSIEVCDLPIPDLKVDKSYIGSMPIDTVRFSNLNDNIDRKFLHELCEAYGDIQEYKVYFDPSNNKHLGTGKVVFDEKTRIYKVVAALNGRQIMGQAITAYAETKNPPGQVMFKELEAECLQYRTKENLLNNNHQSINQPTPSTPNISSLHRTHPIASGMNNNDSYRNEKPPPPPPLMLQTPEGNNYRPQHLGNLPPQPPSRKFEDISPTVTEFNKKNWSNRKNDYSADALTRTRNMNNFGKYSPVSNTDRSPISPSIKDITPTEKYDHKFNKKSLQTEDISPVDSPNNSQQLLRSASVEDDAMSLSSISSNEESKVEVFNQNSKQNNLPLSTYGSITSIQNSYPPMQQMYSSLPMGLVNNQNNQNFQQQQQPPGQFQQQRFAGNNSSSLQNNQQNNMLQNPMNQSQTNLYNPNNNMNWTGNYNDRHTEIIKNALFASANNLPVPQQHPMGLPPQNQLPMQLMNQQLHPQIPNQSSTNHVNNVQPQQAMNLNPNPPNIVSPEMQFLFSVKTGCARNLSQELKHILKKDTLKKLIEQTAFQSFEKWWEKENTKDIKLPLYSEIKIKAESIAPLHYNSTNDKTLIDKSNKIPSQPKPIKETALTTSALLQTLFGHSQNNENRPPQTAANFLNSFRIARKPQIQSSMKGSFISRKRRQWPVVSKNKQRRIEDSEDEDMSDTEEEEEPIEEEEKEEDEEEQFEQFALRQRQVRRSGSSLYQQKIYSDDSEDENEKTQSEDSSSSDESSDESSTTSESESSAAETDHKKETLLPSIPEKNEDETETEEEETGNKVGVETEESSQESQDISESEAEKRKGSFVSMYDEPRRRAAAVANRQQRQKQISKQKKVSSQAAIKQKTKRPVQQISESSDTESASEKELTDHVLTEENNVTIDETKKTLTTETQDEISDLEMLCNLIRLEHNYSSPSRPQKTKTKAKTKEKRRILREKHINKQREYSDDEDNLETIKPEPLLKFSLRTNEQENSILMDIINYGIDAEDLEHFKTAFDHLKESDTDSSITKGLTWGDHPLTCLPPVKQKRQKAEAKLRVHVTGSARSEGYYKIPMVEKATYLKSALRQLNLNKQNEIKRKDPAGTEHKIKSRENRAMQRRLASSIAEEYGSLLNFNNKLKMRKKALRFAKSSIHNWGLFACEPIAAEEMVCEYVGQMVRAVVAEIREKRYEKMGIGSSYLFRLDMESVIDATKHGCSARFINHCCDPNCYAKVILVEGAKKIVIYSRRHIKVNEEITYDYKFPLEDEKIPCLCGAAACRGSLN